MLQVITGMYFGDVALNETKHRRTLYTNADFSVVGPVAMPVGNLAPATDRERVNTVLLEFTECLEAVLPDGTEDFMISTGGDEIAEDLAVVLSFALNATFTLTREKADRLINEPSASARRLVAADVMPRTFTPHLVLRPADIEDLRAFMTRLLALHREAYERAIKAMRRIVTASERVAEDPTLAYTDYVAALESLSAGTPVPDTGWDRYPHEKKRILDPVLAELSEEQADQVRSAILAADKAGIAARYRAFMLSHVRPSFFRQEAAGVVGPVTEPALQLLVTQSYTTRSKSIHELRELRREAWLHAGGAHTIDVPKAGPMLTHEGLNRLARHVIRTFVYRGPTDLDRTFRWRENLPNVIQVRLAPEFYLGNPESMTKSTAAFRAGEFFGYVTEVLAGRDKHMRVDMRPVLERIEDMLATHRSPAIREPMLAIYLLWHRVMATELHRPAPDAVMKAALTELKVPSMCSFTVGALLGHTPPWSLDDLCELAEQRYEELNRRQHVELPPRVDSALWALVAHRLLSDGAPTLALAAIDRAVKCSPGNEDFMELERRVVVGQLDDPDLKALILGQSSPSQQAGTTATEE
ncbi:hypothetical protein F4558_002886 [Micromonospora profundi]|uniref:hypothetical protein n=1 Tax=Micromonospora profundi TaxID=1420889 RepID=UPI001438C9E9|nr:hypothetical protein [Micromonospora profundi]NJC13060.1 hypothetical protein [Micromonospora profundi]